jgi:hypothetical protein
VVVLGIPGWWVARRPGRHARGQAADGLTAGADQAPRTDTPPVHPSGPFPVRGAGAYPGHPSGPLPVPQDGTYAGHLSGPLPVRRPGAPPGRPAGDHPGHPAGEDPALKSVVWDRLAHPAPRSW